MIYKSMLDEQINAKSKEHQLMLLRRKQEDLMDLERIRRENEELEAKKLSEDELLKDRAQRMREFNLKNPTNSGPDPVPASKSYRKKFVSQSMNVPSGGFSHIKEGNNHSRLKNDNPNHNFQGKKKN